MDASGNVLASYSYNAWGKVLTATGSMAAINPIRYMGYYYDSDTELYYLLSRYYDPEICRFVNADSYASTGQGISGTNMFAYCLNNPVNAADDSGDAFEWIVDKLERLLDGAAVHKLVQIVCSMGKGWEMEKSITVVNNKGKTVTGRLDLYDPNTNSYYEIKSEESYRKNLDKIQEQMKKYDEGIVKSTGLSPMRGKETVKGTLYYGIYDVGYKSVEPGLIIYSVTPNGQRALALAALGIGAAVASAVGNPAPAIAVISLFT